jgi:Ser/Thr protein kinase RdoA (MazF antagonist)
MKESILSFIQPGLVTKAAAQWDSTEDAILLDDVTNMVYEFKSLRERRILRLTHSSHHTEDEIIAELDWINFLIQQGVPASAPLLSRNNRQTECYPVQNSYFVATAFKYAPGHFIDWSSPQDWNPTLIQTFGQIVGRMHRVTKHYNPQNLKQKRSHWYEDDTIKNAADYLPADQRQAAIDLEELMEQFNRIPPTTNDYGLVHGDLNPTNFHVNERQLILFDFDDCAYNWFINDIAIAIPLHSESFTHKDWETKITEFFQWFMRGYSEENQIDEEWLEYLPMSLRLQNIIDLIALHQSNIPNSRYHSFYDLVLKTYQEGHPLFLFNFRKVYKSLAANTSSTGRSLRSRR